MTILMTALHQENNILGVLGTGIILNKSVKINWNFFHVIYVRKKKTFLFILLTQHLDCKLKLSV